jgi:hypothetical protein
MVYYAHHASHGNWVWVLPVQSETMSSPVSHTAKTKIYGQLVNNCTIFRLDCQPVGTFLYQLEADAEALLAGSGLVFGGFLAGVLGIGA